MNIMKLMPYGEDSRDMSISIRIRRTSMVLISSQLSLPAHNFLMFMLMFMLALLL